MVNHGDDVGGKWETDRLTGFLTSVKISRLVRIVLLALAEMMASQHVMLRVIDEVRRRDDELLPWMSTRLLLEGSSVFTRQDCSRARSIDGLSSATLTAFTGFTLSYPLPSKCKLQRHCEL